MKKTYLVMILVFSLVLTSSLVLADDNEDINNKIEINFDDQDFNNFRANGGPMMGALRLKLDKLNDALTTANFAKLDEKNIIVYGGGGVGGLKDGSRFGGYGLSGKITSITGNKKVVLSIDYGGFLYEKGLLVAEKTGTDLSFGLLMGGGNAELKLIYDDLGDEFSNTISSAKMNILKKEFILLEPKLNLHQQLGPFLGFDLSYGYLATYDFGETWKINDQIITGPFDNFQTPSLTARLSFGF